MAQFMAPQAIGLQLAGGIYGAVSESDAMRADARNDEANALDAERFGARDALDKKRRARAIEGEALAALGMNGVAIDTGSPLDLIAQNAVEAEWDILNARYGAAREAQALRMQAAGKRKGAKQALIGGLIGAGAQALGSFSSLSQGARVNAAAAKARMPSLPGTTMPVPAGTWGTPGHGAPKPRYDPFGNRTDLGGY